MDEAVVRARLPSKKSLENYASAYIGAYMNAIEKEKPERLPVLSRNSPFEIEVCLMPNHSFAMLFERADRQHIVVEEKDWTYVEGKVMSGAVHLVTVYAHEGPTVADAIAKGKRDAVRDVRALEDSNLGKAVEQLERILEDLAAMGKGNTAVREIVEAELSKLRPIKEAVRSAGPEVDMLAMIDALRNYPSVPVDSGIDVKERLLLESIANDLGDLSDVIRRVEAQDERLEQMELTLAKSLSEFGKTVDEKVGKGLAVVLSSSDRKIDKGLAEMQNTLQKAEGARPPENLEKKLAAIEKALQALEERRDVSSEVLMAVAEVRENMGKLNTRITKIEQFLVNLTSRVKPPSK